MNPAPWHESVPELLRGSVEHRYTFTATPAGASPIPLEITAGSVTWDEGHAPRVSADLAVVIPDQATLDALDPRLRRVSVDLAAGYVLPGGAADVHPVCRLDLAEAVARRPANDLFLRMTGREARLTEALAVGTGPSWTSATDARDAILFLLNAFDPGVPVAIDDELGPFVTGLDSLAIGPGDQPWAMVQDIADRVGVEVYHDGAPGGSWTVERPRPVPEVTEAFFATGPRGNVRSSESARSRVGRLFTNQVIVEYQYMTDSGPQRAIGSASASVGPGSITDAGRVSTKVVRPWRGTTADAENAARTMVERGVSGGRSLSFESTHAMYWLRPGSLIQVQLPAGPPIRHIVSRLDVDFPTGTQHITTRLPESTEITYGE